MMRATYSDARGQGRSHDAIEYGAHGTPGMLDEARLTRVRRKPGGLDLPVEPRVSTPITANLDPLRGLREGQSVSGDVIGSCFAQCQPRRAARLGSSVGPKRHCGKDDSLSLHAWEAARVGGPGVRAV